MSKRTLDQPSWLSRFVARLRALFDPTPPLHTLYATYTLPYAPLPVYNLITDIPSYPQFVPFVTSARVTAWSPRADAHHERHWPAVAALEVAFGDKMRESFSANLVCAPPTHERGEGIVEAFGGEAVPEVMPEHYDEYVAKVQKGSPLRTVRALWTVKEVQEGAQVRLRVEYAFRSQVFEQVGTSMAKKVADQVAEAFQARAKQVLRKHEGNRN